MLPCVSQFCAGISQSLLEVGRLRPKNFFQPYRRNLSLRQVTQLAHRSSIIEKVSDCVDSVDHREYFNSIAKIFGIKETTDWLSVDPSKLKHLSEDKLVAQCYGGSLRNAFATVYPEHGSAWKFLQAPRSIWSSNQNVRNYCDWFAEQSNITSTEQWYNVRPGDLISKGGRNIMEQFQYSVSKLLSVAYPDREWDMWQFARVPDGYWEDPKVQRRFFDWLAQHLDVTKASDWYRVKPADVVKSGGSSLLQNHYSSSIGRAITNVYPECEWDTWKFDEADAAGSRRNRRHVKKPATTPRSEPLPQLTPSTLRQHRHIFDEAAKQLGLQSLDNWYSFTTEELEENGFQDLMFVIRKHHESLPTALASLYPEHPWQMWRFHQVPKQHWMVLANQRRFFDSLAEDFGVKELEDWYQVQTQQVLEKTAGLLQLYYNSSLPAAIASVYPEMAWNPWQFTSIPRSFWLEEENIVAFLKWVEIQLKLTAPEHWYNVSVVQFGNLGGYRLMKVHGGLPWLLPRLYPNHVWDPADFRSVGKSQHELQQMIESLFPGHAVLSNHKHEEMLFAKSQKNMELDLYIPSLSFAIEFQGHHHYQPHYLYGEPKVFQQRDQEKRQRCAELGIKLVEIPYWWDHNKFSVAATINKHYPELLSCPADAFPIPEEPPSSSRKKNADLNNEEHFHQRSQTTDPAGVIWEDLLSKQQHVHFISLGKPGGRWPTCWSCKTVLHDRNALRVVVKSIVTPLGSQQQVPQTVLHSMCATPTCLRLESHRQHQHPDRYKTETRSTEHRTPFKNVIYVPPALDLNVIAGTSQMKTLQQLGIELVPTFHRKISVTNAGGPEEINV